MCTAALAACGGPLMSVLGEELNNFPLEFTGGLMALYSLCGIPMSLVSSMSDTFEGKEELKQAIVEAREMRKDIAQLKSKIKQTNNETQKR